MTQSGLAATDCAAIANNDPEQSWVASHLYQRRWTGRSYVFRNRSTGLILCRLWAAIAFIVFSFATIVHAQPDNNIDNLSGWLEQPTMTGDWGGLRTDLEQRGINVMLSYVGAGQRNTNGLDGVATDYAQQFFIGTNVDLGLLGLDPGGNFHFVMNERAGRDLGPEKLGSLYQTIAAYGQGRIMRLSEISLEQSFFDTLLNVKVGLFPMSGTDYKEYIWLPAFGDFLTNAHHPVSIAMDSSGVDYFPTGHWGTRIRVSPLDGVSILAGVFQVNPEYYQSPNGFKIDFQGDTGAVFPLEFTYKPSLGVHLPGMYKFGAYYDTSRAPDELTPTKLDQGREGYYFEMQQKVYSESDNPARGLTIVGYYASNDLNTGPLKQTYHAGLSYRGLIPDRESDTLSIGWFAADINPRAVEREGLAGNPVQSATEHLLEINYGAQVARWLAVTPGVQYVVNPGSVASHPNAWVFVFQVQSTL